MNKFQYLILIFITLFGMLSCMNDVGMNFRVDVSKITEKSVSEITFIVDDVRTSFTKFDDVSERRIYIPVPENDGTFDIVVTFSDGEKIDLKGKEYRSGSGVYISVRDSGINYTKAHW